MKVPDPFGHYPEADWPFTFYFNGEALPKWSACWPSSLLNKHLRDEDDGYDVCDRDVELISHKIDHVGIVESAPPAVFIFSIQRVLMLLLEHEDDASASITMFQGSPDPVEVRQGLIDGCFRMREFVQRDRVALWTSGYEADQIELKKLTTELGSESRPSRLFPHQQSVSFMLGKQLEHQLKQIHRLAQNGKLDKAMRSRLHQLSMPDESFLNFVT